MRPASAVGPAIRVLADPRPARGLVLLLHGGRANSHEPAHQWRLAYRRMLPFGAALRRGGRRHGLAVWLLRYRYRGWNGASRSPVLDAQWALDQARDRHPGVPVALVGHSMGGRAALYVAGDPAVVAVCALAPWVEPADPVGQFAGRSVLIAHGDLDRMTDPRASYRYAVAARRATDRVGWVDVTGDGHAMLRRAQHWSHLVRRFVLGELGMWPVDARIEAAMAAPDLRTPTRTPVRGRPQ